jgi:hypothetical protein
MERIGVQHLRNIVDLGKQSPSRDETTVRYYLATILLRHYLGSAWCDEECVKRKGLNATGRICVGSCRLL